MVSFTHIVKVESSSSEDEFEPTGLCSRSPTPSTSGIAVQTPVSSSPPPLMHVACGQSTPQSSDSPLQGSAYRCCFRHCEGEVQYSYILGDITIVNSLLLLLVISSGTLVKAL